MERWERSGTHLRRGREVGTSPSFSSSLLDAIYRSIDEGDGRIDTCKGGNRARNYGHEKDDLSYVTTTTTRKCFDTMVETKKQIATVLTEKAGHRHREKSYISEFDRRTFKPNQDREKYVLNSTSSSSESSYGGFSSSEAESARVKSYGRPPSLAIRSERSAIASLELKKKHKQDNQSTSIGNRFRESKIYSELKKAKTPISPGGRLASFINHLFNSAAHSKNAKTSFPTTTSTVTRGVRGGDDSTCSSASSYSKSCLGKNPSSRTKTTNSGKRSVRFYPVSIILGDDLRPCGQKCVYDDHIYGYEKMEVSAAPPLPTVRVRHTVVEEEKKATDLTEKPYNGKRAIGLGFEEDEDDDDDAASYSSSDLFELENLTTICGDGERYSDELPVYETTHLHTNRAIVQGLIV